MKKTILALLLSVVSVLTLTLGISFSNNPQMKATDYTDASTTQAEGTTAPTENEAETVTTAPPSRTRNENTITPELALSIALNDAGFSESEIRDKEAELDYEKGVLVYEVSFENGRTEYDYIINAQSGEIIFSNNRTPDSTTTTAPATAPATASPENRITSEQAINIALQDADFTLSEVYDREAELDYEKGILVYEVSFENRNTEYEYVINAQSGEIIRTEIDPY